MGMREGERGGGGEEGERRESGERAQTNNSLPGPKRGGDRGCFDFPKPKKKRTTTDKDGRSAVCDMSG